MPASKLSYVLLGLLSLTAACAGPPGSPDASDAASLDAASDADMPADAGALPVELAIVLYTLTPFSPTAAPESQLYADNRVFAAAVCTIQEEGPCRVVDCRAPSPATPMLRNAGTITVSSGPTTSMTLSPQSDGTYAVSAGAGTVFTGGSQVTFAGSGGTDIPSFMESMLFPERIIPTSPDLTTTVLVSRSEPLVVRWMPASGTVEFGVRVSTTDASFIVASCRAPGADGTLTMPTSVLSQLPEPASPITNVEYLSVADQELVAGGHRVVLFGANGGYGRASLR